MTCVDVELASAKDNIAAMHGPHRMPTLLKTVDRMCREHALSGEADVAQVLPQS